MITRDPQTVNRHRTAIRRYGHSKPIAIAIAHGLITQDLTVLDYGCGRGEDVRLLNESGVSAAGWDPYHRPDTRLGTADVVNLGYVLNVIEDPAERAQTLLSAFGFARKLLIVSVRVDRSLDTAAEYGDGLITKVGTFQKIFTQAEFREYLEGVLNTRPHMASLGVAYVFKEPDFESQYLAGVSFNLPQGSRQDVVDQFRKDELAHAYVEKIGELGRPPLESEFPAIPDLIARFGSPDRIRRIVERLLDPNSIAATRDVKRENILTYLAMMKLQGLKPPPISALPADIRADLKALWSNYAAAIADSVEFLFQLGKPDIVAQQCRKATIGKKLPEDLYVHASAANQLPPLLRLLTFAARQVVGEIEHDLIKVSMHGRSVSFLKYGDFEQTAHPELRYSLRVFLPTATYTIRDYTTTANPPILHRKETFVDGLHSRYAEFAALTAQEEALGLLSRPDIGTRKCWLELLRSRGLRVEGHSIVSDPQKALDVQL
jgi:DNA phosphorothioation-associated putative methyltransferase